MRRREFITLLGGTAATWPIAAWGQQPGRIRRIGVIIVQTESNPAGQAHIAAFHKGLRDSGWIEGRNVSIDYRWGAGDADRAQAYADELVALSPDVIVANGSSVLSALKRATQKIPIVFVVVADPVVAGYVESQSRPGGNITGFSTFEPEIGGKWLQLLEKCRLACDAWRVFSIPHFRALPKYGAPSSKQRHEWEYKRQA